MNRVGLTETVGALVGLCHYTEISRYLHNWSISRFRFALDDPITLCVDLLWD